MNFDNNAYNILIYNMQREDSISKLKPDEKQIECYRYNFKKGRLGKGTFGTVFKGVNINNK